MPILREKEGHIRKEMFSSWEVNFKLDPKMKLRLQKSKCRK